MGNLLLSRFCRNNFRSSFPVLTCSLSTELTARVKFMFIHCFVQRKMMKGKFEVGIPQTGLKPHLHCFTMQVSVPRRNPFIVFHMLYLSSVQKLYTFICYSPCLLYMLQDTTRGVLSFYMSFLPDISYFMGVFG